MDIAAGISTAALASTAMSNGDAVTVSVMKKAMDIQATSAAQLISSVAQSTQALPDNLGRNINVTA
jgi:hypothetical protein